MKASINCCNAISQPEYESIVASVCKSSTCGPNICFKLLISACSSYFGHSDILGFSDIPVSECSDLPKHLKY